MIRPFVAASLILPLRLWTTGVRAAEFTPAQRAEIVAIMRDALKKDPSILRDAIVALQADEGERTQQATRAAIAAGAVSWWLPADPVAGDPHGDVTIVEFFDTRCPYCRKLEPVMDSFLAKDAQGAAGLQGSADPGAGQPAGKPRHCWRLRSRMPMPGCGTR